MPTTEDARAALAASDIPGFISAVRRASAARSPGIGALAVECLADHRHNVRNICALSLIELGEPGTGNAIRAALVRPGVPPQSGTLVYALSEMGEPMDLGSVLALAESGSFEARAEAHDMMLARRILPIPEEDRHAALARLEPLAALDDEVGLLAQAAPEAIRTLDAASSAR